MERKFPNERCQNGMKDNLPYQFYSRFRAMYLQKNIYGCRVVIKNIVTEEFNFNIYAYYLATNCGTFVVYIAQAVYVLHHSAVNTVHCNLQH